MAAPKKTTLDPAKLYAVQLARVVEHEGFTFRPGPEPIEMAGGLALALGDAVAEARELPPAEPHPEPAVETHEQAEI